MTQLLMPHYKDVWWPEGAFVHVIKDHPIAIAAGKTHEVCTGKLIRCPYTACMDPEFDRGSAPPCNGLAISLRVHDPEASIVLSRRWESDGVSTWATPHDKSSIDWYRERSKAGDKVVTEWSDGSICPKAICFAYVTRKRRKGFRWCGHKTSGPRCRCRHGFAHLRKGGW